jgi:hypothetical protein
MFNLLLKAIFWGGISKTKGDLLSVPNRKLSKHVYLVKNAVDSSVAHGVEHNPYRINIRDDCQKTLQNFYVAQKFIPVILS